MQKQARDGKRIICDRLTYHRLQEKSLVTIEGPTRFHPHVDSKMSFDTYVLSRAIPKETLAPPGPGYDLFISYRREGGNLVARGLQQALLQRGFKVFLDVDTLPGGHFDTNLLHTIDSTAAFLVVLSPGCLDRCQHEGDWLRREIVQALNSRKNILPITLPEFSFPAADKLPPSMAEIVRHDAIEYSHRYFEAMMDKIQERIKVSS